MPLGQCLDRARERGGGILEGALREGAVARRLLLARTRDGGLALNPDREEKFDLGPQDEVVVLTTYAEPDVEPTASGS